MPLTNDDGQYADHLGVGPDVPTSVVRENWFVNRTATRVAGHLGIPFDVALAAAQTESNHGHPTVLRWKEEEANRVASEREAMVSRIALNLRFARSTVRAAANLDEPRIETRTAESHGAYAQPATGIDRIILDKVGSEMARRNEQMQVLVDEARNPGLALALVDNLLSHEVVRQLLLKHLGLAPELGIDASKAIGRANLYANAIDARLREDRANVVVEQLASVLMSTLDRTVEPSADVQRALNAASRLGWVSPWSEDLAARHGWLNKIYPSKATMAGQNDTKAEASDRRVPRDAGGQAGTATMKQEGTQTFVSPESPDHYQP